MKLKEALVKNGSAEDEQAAQKLIEEMSEQAMAMMMEGEGITQIEDILYQYNLEPDYIMEILPV